MAVARSTGSARRLALVVLAAAVVIFAAAAVSRSAPARHLRAACTRAKIGGQSECLAPRKACRPRYERIYKSYGYTCKRDRDGRYRLHERIFIGPPNP